MLKRLYWRLVLAGVFILALCILALLFPSSPDVQPSRALIRSVTSKSGSVRFQSTLHRNRLEDEATDTLEITVVNDSDRQVSGLHLAISAPGFALNQANWPCGDPAGNAPLDPLPPHRMCRFVVGLSPAARSGIYGITAFVDWNQANLADHIALALGPVTIDQMWGQARWTRMARRLGSLLKDLTLPVLLAVLGAFFASRQSKRDAERRNEEAARETQRIQHEKDAEKARQDAEKEKERLRIDAEKLAEQKRIEAEKQREERRRDALIEQAERQDVRHLLLTRVMELAEQHYLPFVGHTRLILIEAEKIRDQKPDAAPDKLFLQVLLLLKRMVVFRLSKGGVFLKTRAGERTIGTAWFLLKTRMHAALGDQNADAALNIVRTDWDYDTLKQRFADLQPAWTEFQNWLKQPDDAAALTGSFWQMLGILDAFQAVMAFEADRPLSQYWYEEDAKLVFQLPEPTVLYVRQSAVTQDKTKTSELEVLLRDEYSRSVQVIELI